jgi:hypothetical protein
MRDHHDCLGTIRRWASGVPSSDPGSWAAEKVVEFLGANGLVPTPTPPPRVLLVAAQELVAFKAKQAAFLRGIPVDATGERDRSALTDDATPFPVKKAMLALDAPREQLLIHGLPLIPEGLDPPRLPDFPVNTLAELKMVEELQAEQVGTNTELEMEHTYGQTQVDRVFLALSSQICLSRHERAPYFLVQDADLEEVIVMRVLAGLDEGLSSFCSPNSRLYGEFL